MIKYTSNRLKHHHYSFGEDLYTCTNKYDSLYLWSTNTHPALGPWICSPAPESSRFLSPLSPWRVYSASHLRRISSNFFKPFTSVDLWITICRVCHPGRWPLWGQSVGEATVAWKMRDDVQVHGTWLKLEIAKNAEPLEPLRVSSKNM